MDYFNDMPCRRSAEELERDIKETTSEQVESLFDVFDQQQPEAVLPEGFPSFDEFLAMTPEQQDAINPHKAEPLTDKQLAAQAIMQRKYGV